MRYGDETGATRDIASRAARPWLLYFFAPLLLTGVAASLIAGHYRLFFYKLIGFGLYYLAVRCVERGNLEALLYEKAAVARAPRPPCRTLGAAALFATAAFLGMTVNGASWFQSLFVGAVTAAGVLLFYGTDPMEDKLPETEGDINASHLLDTLQEARERLEAIKHSKAAVEDRELAMLLDETVHQAERILRAIENDPALLRLARKFLVVYVEGIAEVMARYGRLKEKGIDTATRERLAALLREANERFEKEREKLERGDRFDLEVQIDAMRELLKQ